MDQEIDTLCSYMPAALERKLKRKVGEEHPDWSQERKDAYTYGTLRKTGWKPSTQKKKEKKMSSVENLIQFAGLGEELPAVGKSLERLRGIVRGRIGQLSKPPTPAKGWGGWFPDIKSDYQASIGQAKWAGIHAQEDRAAAIRAGKTTPPWKMAGTSPGNVGPQYGSPFKQSGRAPRLFSDQSKLVRLAQIDNQLDSIVQFAYDDDDRQGNFFKKASLVGAGAVGAGAGLYGYGLLRRGVNPTAGGLYKAAGTDVRNVRSAVGAGRIPTAAVGDIGRSIGAGARGLAGNVKKYGAMGLKRLTPLLSKMKFWSSRERPIYFDEHILEPFAEGAVPDSKIIQEQFPAGLSPAAALRLPFPELMRLLKQRNLLQQQFPGLAAKLDGLIEFREDTSGKTWKGALGAGAVAAGGYGIYRTHPIKRVKAGFEAASKAAERGIHNLPLFGKEGLRKRILQAGWKGARYAALSAQIDDLIEFISPWSEYNQAAMGLIEPLREKKQRAKERYKASKREYFDALNYNVGKGFPSIQKKIAEESYMIKGAGIGAAAGAPIGAVVGAGTIGRGMGWKGRIGAGALGATVGTLGGAGVGGHIGGRIRREPGHRSHGGGT